MAKTSTSARRPNATKSQRSVAPETTSPADKPANDAYGHEVQIERVEMVNEWPLTLVRETSEPLVMAKDAARRLGFANLIDINKLTRRVFPGEKLKEIHVVATVATTGAVRRVVREFAFTKKQLLKLIMRSETAAAEQIQDEIIDVYDKWTTGQLVDAKRALLDGQAIAKQLEAMRADNLKAWTATQADNDNLRAELAQTKADFAALRAVVEPYAANHDRFRPLTVLKDDPVKVDEFNTKIDAMVRAWKGAGITITRKRAIGIVCRMLHPHGNSYLNLPYGDMADVLNRIVAWTDKPDASLLKRTKARTVPVPPIESLPLFGGLDFARAQKRALDSN